MRYALCHRCWRNRQLAHAWNQAGSPDLLINEIEIEISHELFHFFRSNLHLSADIFRIFEYEMRKFEQN